MAEATYPSIKHGQVNAFAFGRVSATESFMGYAKRQVSLNTCTLPICEQCGKRYNSRGKRFCSVQCYNDWRGKPDDFFDLGLRNQNRPYFLEFINAKYNTGLLFGELGWLMGKYPKLSKHDDLFLEIADAMPNARSLIVDLLTKIEKDGYAVDWESCKLVKVEKRSWRDWLKWKVFSWLRCLVR